MARLPLTEGILSPIDYKFLDSLLKPIGIKRKRLVGRVTPGTWVVEEELFRVMPFNDALGNELGKWACSRGGVKAGLGVCGFFRPNDDAM